MVKLIIFFRKPADEDAFEEHFANNHVPLINAMPNLRRTALTRAIGAPRGEAPYYLIHEAYFEDLPMLTYALNSPEGRAAGADLMTFARDIVSLMFAEVWGEDPFELGLMGHEPAPAETAEELPAPAPEPAKPNLVPIDTSFLEKGAVASAATATLETAVPVAESVAVEAEPTVTETAPASEAEAPVEEAPIAVEAAAPATEAVPSPEAEAPATESTPVETTLATETEVPAAVAPDETQAVDASEPAPMPVAESAVAEAASAAPESPVEDATPSDTPAPADPRPQ